MCVHCLNVFGSQAQLQDHYAGVAFLGIWRLPKGDGMMATLDTNTKLSQVPVEIVLDYVNLKLSVWTGIEDCACMYAVSWKYIGKTWKGNQKNWSQSEILYKDNFQYYIFLW